MTSWWRRSGLAALVAFAWASGVVLRLVSPGVIEYKGDEAWTFENAQQMAHHVPWVNVGMGSSLGPPNPGFSAWIFAILTWVSRASTPVELARAVAVLNVVVLSALFAFAWTRRGPERAIWLWVAALAAVDPLGILMQRKIWPPSVFPLFTFGFFLAWRARQDRLPAFLWGLSGALIPQIHMPGAAFAGAFALWSLYAQLRHNDRQPARWASWAAGSVVGALLTIPWLLQLPQASFLHLPRPPPSALWGNFWRMWLEDVLGRDLEYSLGPEHTRRFGEALGVRVALWASVVVAVVLLALALWTLIVERRAFFARFAWDGAVAHNVAFLGCGLAMTLAAPVIWRHYLFVLYPLQSMTLPLLASLGGRGRRLPWLAAVWLAHAVLAASVLAYLGAHGGAPGGDFGVAFEAQRPGR